MYSCVDIFPVDIFPTTVSQTQCQKTENRQIFTKTISEYCALTLYCMAVITKGMGKIFQNEYAAVDKYTFQKLCSGYTVYIDFPCLPFEMIFT